MNDEKILVLGGNGKTGRRVADRLSRLGKSIRLGSRKETPPFDWENQETWPAVLNGITTVYISYQPDLAVPAALAAIQAFTSLAVKSHVKKLVLLSGRGEKEAQVCEQAVMQSGLDWTIVRASWFNQNFNESFFLGPILAGHVALPRAEALEPFIDADDIAEVVVAALLHKEHSGHIYELTGPRLMTFRQVIQEISAETGRDLAFQPIQVNEYTAMLREYQLPEDQVALIEYLFQEVLDGRNSSITHDVEKVLQRKPKDFSDYLKETASTGIWNPAREEAYSSPS